MKTASKDTHARVHPIQLKSLGVRELSIISNVPPDREIEADVNQCSIRIGITDYDSKTKAIMVTLRLEYGTKRDDVDAPFTLKIEIVGFFEVDESQFPVQHISHWASNNAPLILYPYLREHAFGLSSRCGFRPLLLPLLEVPTFKLERPKPTRRKSK